MRKWWPCLPVHARPIFIKDGKLQPNGQSYADSLVLPPPPEEPYLRIVPLGGCGEIGRNMTVIETNDDLVAVDCGLMFPDDEMFGVDIVINDFSYIRQRATNCARSCSRTATKITSAASRICCASSAYRSSARRFRWR
ncbi:MAG: hypothetical protein ABR591_00985 [Candidatus Velthaea sp.]